MNLENKIKDAVIEASIGSLDEKILLLDKAINEETNKNARWVLDLMLGNIIVSKHKKLPLCDDTGIPHIYIESKNNLTIDTIRSIKNGVKKGLDALPGRPMAVKGNSIERIEQSKGLYSESSMVESAPILIDLNENLETDMKIHLAFLGGGPEIRSKTYRVFHKHSYKTVLDEAISWLKDSLGLLGCTPSIPCIGIGRTHFEATSLMLKGMMKKNINEQSDIEKYITNELNKTNIGPMGLGGKTTVLASCVNIGPQRASGVRIVSVRPACFVEPRVSTVII